jgi:hypothetical protein
VTVHPATLRKLVAEKFLGWRDVVAKTDCPKSVVGVPPGAPAGSSRAWGVPPVEGAVLAQIERELCLRGFAIEKTKYDEFHVAVSNPDDGTYVAETCSPDYATAVAVACLKAVGVTEEELAVVPPKTVPKG